MTRVKRNRLIFSCLLVAVLGVAFVALVRDQHEPFYQGKRLSAWLKELDDEVRAQEGTLSRTTLVAKAIQKIGTNACPTLLAMLRAKDSPLRQRIMQLASRQSLVQFDFMKTDRLRSRARQGFFVLGALAYPAVPSVTALTGDEDPAVRAAALNVLSFIDDDGNKVVPVLIKALQDSDKEVRGSAASALWNIDVHNRSVVFEATGLIPESKLKAAIPVLLALLADRDPDVRQSAASALKQIDPDAAEAAKIK